MMEIVSIWYDDRNEIQKISFGDLIHVPDIGWLIKD